MVRLTGRPITTVSQIMKNTIIPVLLLVSFYSSACRAVGADELVEAAIERTKNSVRYDGSYYSIGYPNGDVPEKTNRTVTSRKELDK